MRQSKLLRLLSIFSREDLHRLKSFVDSPFFNTNKNVSALLAYLLPFAPRFDQPEITARAAYSFVFSNKPTPDKSGSVITKLSSKLLLLAEKYLEHQSLEAEPFTGALFRKRWYRKQRQSVWEAAALDDMLQANQERRYRDEIFSYNGYLIDYESAKWELSAHFIAEKIDLGRVNQSLDAYYLRAKLECLCHLQNHALVANHPYATPEIEWVEKLLELRRTELSPVTLLWMTALHLLTNPSDRNCFFQLKREFLQQEPLLPIPEKLSFFTFLTHSARLVFPAAEDYFNQIFELYQEQLNSGVVLVNGAMAPETFFNILSVALRQKEQDWAFQFVKKYSTLLDPGSDKREDMLALCNSMVAIAQKRYDDALEFLNQTRFKDVQSKLAERRLRLKIYLELGYDALFIDQANSFRKFLSVNKKLIPPHHAEGNRNFISAVMAVMRLRTEPEVQAKQVFDLLEQMTVLPEKTWLEEKAGESLKK